MPVSVMSCSKRQYRGYCEEHLQVRLCATISGLIPYSDYLAAFSQIRAPVVFPTAAPNLEPRDDIWPTDTATVFRRREEGVELVARCGWWSPHWAPYGLGSEDANLKARGAVTGKTLEGGPDVVDFE